LKGLFPLKPEVTYINHCSFGGGPTTVLEKRNFYQR